MTALEVLARAVLDAQHLHALPAAVGLAHLAEPGVVEHARDPAVDRVHRLGLELLGQMQALAPAGRGLDQRERAYHAEPRVLVVRGAESAAVRLRQPFELPLVGCARVGDARGEPRAYGVDELLDHLHRRRERRVRGERRQGLQERVVMTDRHDTARADHRARELG